MIGSTMKTKRTAVCSVALAALALVVSFASQSLAQDVWSLRLSEKEGELAHTNDPMWSKWLMWDIGYQRMVDRNSPYLELTNAASSTDPITEFHITIGDNRFNFAPVMGTDLVALGSTTPGFTLTSSTVGGAGDELVVNIGGGGLAPGQSVRFKIKLGIDASFAAAYANSFGSSLPDYRTVLFDMNGINVYGPDGKTNPDDNSHARVIFDTNIQSGTSVFPDEVVAGPVYFNNIIRAYSQSDMVNLFELNGAPVPEPTSIGLVLLGIVGFSMKARSRGRRLAA
jgi:hypothetical protein